MTLTIDGVTLRDYFATHAPTNASSVYLLNWTFSEQPPTKPEGYDYWLKGGSADREALTEKCHAYDVERREWEDRRALARDVAARYAYADAMLAARDQRRLPTNEELLEIGL